MARTTEAAVWASAVPYLPRRVSLSSLRLAAEDCHGCPLVERDDAYVTNVVKHFKWIAVHRRRMHKKPNAREIAACVPWLEKEIEVVKPEILVCMGATAAQALLGPEIRVTRDRGVLMETRLAPHAMATVHPSSILRQQTSEERHREMERFTADLRIVAHALA